MSRATHPVDRARRGSPIAATDAFGADNRALVPLLIVFAMYEWMLGLLLWLAPRYFFEHLGPYGGAPNDHYMADLSTWYLALGAATLVAARRPDWRVPVLVVSLIQNVLHMLSHLLDFAEPHPGWHGPVDSTLLAAATVVLGWMLVLAARSELQLRDSSDR